MFVFLLYKSWIDRINNSIPIYEKPSHCWIDYQVDEAIDIIPVKSGECALDQERNLYVEPESINLIRNSNDLSKSTWIKGSNVNIISTVGIVNEKKSNIVSWSSGTGDSQFLYTNIESAIGGEYYTFSCYLRLLEGNFSSRDNIICKKFGVNRTIIPLKENLELSKLNEQRNRFFKLERIFKLDGVTEEQEKFFLSEKDLYNFELPYLTVAGLTPEDIYLSASSAISVKEDAWKGAKLIISKSSGTIEFEIISNEQFEESSYTIKCKVDRNPIVAGVQVTDYAIVSNEITNLKVGFYIEGNVKLEIIGTQFEPHPFSTSLFIQGNSIIPKSGIKVEYLINPLSNLQQWSILIKIEFIRGSGVFFQIGRSFIVATEEESLIIISRGREVIKTRLEQKDNIILVIEKDIVFGQMRVYLNDKLLAKKNNIEISFRLNDFLTFPGEILFKLRFFAISNKVFGSVTDDIQKQTKSRDLLNFLNLKENFFKDYIKGSVSRFSLTTTKIPGDIRERYSIPVKGIDFSARRIEVDLALLNLILNSNEVVYFYDESERNYISINVRDLYQAGKFIVVKNREEQTETYLRIESRSSSGNNGIFIVSTSPTVRFIRGKTKIYPDISSKPYSYIRYPFIAKAKTKVTSVSSYSLNVESTQNFSIGPAIVISNGIEIDRIKIKRITGNTLETVNNLNHLSGFANLETIQIEKQLTIGKKNVFVDILEEIENIEIEYYNDGVKIINNNPEEIWVTPILEVNL